MKNYCKLMRVKHWIKNILIFVPAFCAGKLMQTTVFFQLFLGFLSFSFASSVVYIINDLKDVEKDRKHEIKCKRPIASGVISEGKAKFVAVLLIVLAILLNSIIRCEHSCMLFVWCGIYIAINIAYSMGLKNVPIIDIAILAMGFVIRIFYGAVISNVEVSSWLCLAVMAFALYMGMGKRRNELNKVGDNSTREVLKYYDVELLDKNMTIVTALGLVFYSLWAAMVTENSYLVWTVPLVFFIIMKYEMQIRGNSYGDPVEVLLSDKILMMLVVLYMLIMLFLMYFV